MIRIINEGNGPSRTIISEIDYKGYTIKEVSVDHFKNFTEKRFEIYKDGKKLRKRMVGQPDIVYSFKNLDEAKEQIDEFLNKKSSSFSLKKASIEVFKKEGFTKGYGVKADQVLMSDTKDFKMSNPYSIAYDVNEAVEFILIEGELLEEILDLSGFEYDEDEEYEMIDKISSYVSEYVSPSKLINKFRSLLNSSNHGENFVNVNGSELWLINQGGGSPDYYIYDKDNIENYFK